MPDLVAILSPSPLAVLVVALAGAPATAILGWRRPRLGAAVAIVSALLALLAVAALWRAGGGRGSVPWVPAWSARLDLSFDGISAVYGLLATGIGSVVLIYSSAYLSRHLAHHGRDEREATSFYALILLFMGAMVGLVMAGDLFLLFVFWDLTAVVSYLLIGFDRDEPLSRPAALMALVITAGSAVLMLAGIVVLWFSTGTTSIPIIAASASDGTAFSIAVGLIAIAALAKSAQVPLHIWLPRAMVAPTPVSSYLHSAAMVAAGVFLLSRLLPLIHRAAWVPEALIAVGLASMLIGGLIAIGRDDMKQILAYSTIGQYGYVVVMLGLGGASGAIGAAFYVIAHALAKCALFLTAGAVTEATERRRLSELGGLLRAMPLLGVASGIAAATLAAMPLTIGFFKDELFFAAMHERGPAFTVAAVAAAALTLAYIGRFWFRIFLGPSPLPAQPLPVAMTGSIAVLAALCLLGGIWVGPANALANAAGNAALPISANAALAYHLEWRAETIMALAAYGVGLAAIATMRWWEALSSRLAAVAARIGPNRLYRSMLEGINALSDRLHGYELHDLRGRIATVLLPVGFFVALTLIFTPNEGAFLVGEITFANLFTVLVLIVTCATALTATRVANHLSLVLLLSAVGFPLAAVYAFIGSPDVALVAVLMETMVTILFVSFLTAMGDRPLVEGFEREPSESHLGRDRFVGLVTMAAAFVIVWGVLSKPAAIESAAHDQIALTPSAHAQDVVTAILADFRGLDTMGEITVIGIALVGMLALLQRPWQRRPRQ
jgi:multicomponent Na+:H+ antiporter subunit A